MEIHVHNIGALIQQLPGGDTEDIGIKRFGSELDLVYCDRDVITHTDNDGSDKSKNVVLLCLVGGGRIFHTKEFCDVIVRAGTIIRFDGSIPHSLFSEESDTGSRSAFIIWDVPVGVPTRNFIHDLRERVHSLELEIVDYLYKN